jgi:molybdate transport system regulatory protein
MPGKKVDATLSLRRDGRLLIGRDRIMLLEAVADHGTITRAAEACGFSYKTAWDAVNSINNLLPRPAFITRAGGEKGGGAEITPEGLRLIAAFRRLEEKLAQITAAIAEDGVSEDQDVLFLGLGVKISARNAFRCVVSEVKPAPVDVEVTLTVSESNELAATVTNHSVTELGLKPGRTVMAFVNAPLVTLLPDGAGTPAARRNEFHGIVLRRTDGGINAEISVDIGEGKTITAVIASDSADCMSLNPGAAVRAQFKPSHVILAAD